MRSIVLIVIIDALATMGLATCGVSHAAHTSEAPRQSVTVSVPAARPFIALKKQSTKSLLREYSRCGDIADIDQSLSCYHRLLPKLHDRGYCRIDATGRIDRCSKEQIAEDVIEGAH